MKDSAQVILIIVVFLLFLLGMLADHRGLLRDEAMLERIKNLEEHAY